MALVGGDFASAFFQNTLFARSVWSGGARCPLRTLTTSDRTRAMKILCGMKRIFRPYATPAMAGLGTLCVNQILEDANADIDLYSPVEKLMELKTERENILIALVESQSEPAPVDAADGGRRVES